jgi:uncharacterized protein YdeI (YjbR/CyaY-like superfamily)
MSSCAVTAWFGVYVNRIRRRAELEITDTFEPDSRAAWRAWLDANHATKKEIWLVTRKGEATLTYRESVYEALCFGWIDGIAKRIDPQRSAQRFTPRRPKGNWTELNKERARRLIDEGLMTEAGRAVLPDLSPEAFTIAPDIIDALKADAATWSNFQAFPDLYKRIRISYVEETRKQPAVFKTRLDNFLTQTARNKMFGGME